MELLCVEIDQPGRAKYIRADELYKGVKIADAYKFPWLQNAGKKGKHVKRCVKCSICSDVLFRSKLLSLSESHRIPPIVDPESCRISAKVVIDHALSSIHKAAGEANAHKKAHMEGSDNHPWIAFCSKVNRDLFQKLVIFTLDDAKTETLSAWSWPARHLAQAASTAFLASETKQPEFNPSFADIQYINPEMHHDLLHSIADVSRQNLVTELETALAVSLLYDGSVDA